MIEGKKQLFGWRGKRARDKFENGRYRKRSSEKKNPRGCRKWGHTRSCTLMRCQEQKAGWWQQKVEHKS